MTITTPSLDRAAFLLVFFSTLKEIDGRCPDNIFTIEASRWVLWYEKVFGWVPYEKFVKKRHQLKQKTRKKAGLPIHYTGKSKPFLLEDLLKQ